MKQGIISAILLYWAVATTAIAATGGTPTLNRIAYQLTEQQWVIADRAKVVIAVNATIPDQNVTRLRQSITSNLQKIATAEWHITQFNRHKTNSGLLQVNALAEARLATAALDTIYSRLKTISTAGQTYSVSTLNFDPEPKAIVAAQAALRQKVYIAVQAELKRLNSQFANSRYFVHQIQFMSGQPVPVARTATLMKTEAEATTPNAVSQVSQKVTLNAAVVLSSTVKSAAE